MAMVEGYDALTEKEKQTLRLLLEGHDAKSMARQLTLSVHTINERLRDARRKLAVSSSKEAARMLRSIEAPHPDSIGDKPLRDAASAPQHQQVAEPAVRSRSRRGDIWAIGGLAMILMLAGALALSAPSQLPQADTAPASAAVTESVAVKTARNWLTLVDQAKWAESWAGTGARFRSANTIAKWQAASEQARVPLGRVLSRTFVEERDVPARPNGVHMVLFHTDFFNRKGATETLSLERDGDAWKVAGIYIE